jgi:DNA-binding transcriptional LysR family regulator
MHDLDLTTLRLFVATCELRNIARAGQQQNIGASAISKRLALLEEQVHAPLLERHRRGVVPTTAGEILLEHARVMLAAADRVARDMAAWRHGVKGQVRVLASMSSIAEFLPDDVASFLKVPAHADIRVDIEERVSPEVVSAVREGLAPLGICWDAADMEGLQTRPYRSDRLAVIAHPDHPVARLAHCSFAQSLAYEHVGLPPSTAVYTMLARAAAVAGRPLNYRTVVSTFDASLRCVRANLGIAVVPREVAEPFTAIGTLREVPLTDAWATRHFAICLRDEALLSPSARLLLAHLQAAAGGAVTLPPRSARRRPRG